MAMVKRLLVGRPIATVEEEGQRLPKSVGLAVFSSDPISSSAYATEEILFVVAVGGSSLALGLNVLVPMAVAVAILLTIVVISYRQTIYAYPGGGGAYVVSRENLNETSSLVAGASLMVDYILTAAVSVSAGVAAILSISTFSDLREHRVLLCLGILALLMLANLRGVKEAGRIFAIPTYVYVVVLGALIVYGLVRSFSGDIDPIVVDPEAFEGSNIAGGELGLFLILKGFSSGAVALTGTEAIATGVPAFRRPESRNAAITLTWMGFILGALFFGTALLADRLGPYPSHEQTVLAQLGDAVFGDGAMFLLLQAATAAILVLAANTAYSAFPRLSSIMAVDGYLPRQLANRGDRLVFSNGIVFLTLAAAALIVAFRGLTNLLIPLYAVGVFMSFTLSQTGMVRHHRKEREPGWKRKAVTQGVGAVGTFVVLMVVAVTKFTSGAWVSLVVMLGIVLFFKFIARHYRSVSRSLSVPTDFRPRRMNHTVVVLVGTVHRGVLEALAYARSLTPNHLAAVTVVTDEEQQERIESAWAHFGIEVPLEIVYSPYRELTRPVLRYIDEVDARYDNDIVTVVIPEFVVKRWWQHLLHNQSALILKGRLLFRKGTVVTSVPYHVE